jgi:hypothetical protein
VIFVGKFGGAITGEPITGIIREEERSPRQLFDINFEIDDPYILSVKDLVSRVSFTSFGTEPTHVELTFVILDSEGNNIRSWDESTIVETEKVLTKKFEDFDLDYGRYTLFLKTLYNEDVEDEFWENFEVRRSMGSSLLQLFDIRFEIDDSTIQGTEELVARVLFESFGTEPSPVDMTFIFLDENKNEIYEEHLYTIVETEKVFVKKFGDLGFKDGKYSLILRTLYNVDVEDEFIRTFEIKSPRTYLWVVGFSIFVNIVLIVLIFRLLKNVKFRTKKSKKKRSKKK